MCDDSSQASPALLDEYLAMHHVKQVSFAKIDIEGYESRAFSGLVLLSQSRYASRHVSPADCVQCLGSARQSRQ